jgi:hypothetical protein
VSTSKTAFNPEEHGFPWENVFDAEEIVTSWFDQGLMTRRSASEVLVSVHGGPARELTAEMLDFRNDEIVEEMARLIDSTGLAAGMCLVALDRYRRDLSPWKRKPGRRSHRYADLTRSSFRVFGRWSRLGEILLDMGRPDVTHRWDETKSLGQVSIEESLPRIRDRLADGNPVPVLLYRSRWNPFANDVVLAHGASESRNNKVRLDLYDPNHREVGSYLTIDLERENQFRLAPKSAYGLGGDKIRGFRRVRVRLQGTEEQDASLLAHLAVM